MPENKREPEGLINFVVQSGRFYEMVRFAAQQPNGPYVIVICDLHGEKRIGATVAEVLNPQDFQARDSDADIWTFLYPLDLWQEFRERTVKTRDLFEGPAFASRFAVVTDHRVLIGTLTVRD